MKIFVIYDKKATSHGPLMTYPNKGLALRAFGELVHDEKTSLNKYPADFSIWLIGEYDEKLGQINPLSKPEFVDEAVNAIKKEG